MLRATSFGAATVNGPSSDRTTDPSPISTSPPLSPSSSVPPWKSVPANSHTAPAPAALTATVPDRWIESPPYRPMFPSPPPAVTSALTIKSSSAVSPSAAR